MRQLVDARGMACPAPVMRTRDALRSGAKELEVLVDNEAARENVTRFASSQGCDVRVEQEGGFSRLIISGGREAEASPQETAAGEKGARNLVILSSDVMGRNEELGSILMKSFLNTMCESDQLPWRLVLFNRGVLLALKKADTVTALSNLERTGVEILVCGTCLDYFQAKERLGAGRVSNMYEIVDAMLMATNSVTI